MALKLFNTMGRKKQLFKPIKEGHVGIYSCGPTIYTYVHLGNFLKETQNNLLRNYLKYKGYKVTYVSNITDVEDKIITTSQKQGIYFRDLTAKFIPLYFDDLKAMHIDRADIIPKATEHIPEMVALIKRLLEKGIAYKGEDGSIYYSISKFKNYGKLSGTKINELKAGARVKQDEYTKENAQDFALWKAWMPEDGDVFWETELGKGRPGWHIECSAMSTKYLGEHFDIHAGGEDLIFPHHENEIAQTEGATGKKWVNYWFHNGFLMVDGKKMSKSLGNFYTLRDVIAQGYNPLTIKYFFLNGHYRSQVNFTFESLANAENGLKKIVEFMQRLDSYKDGSAYNKGVAKLVDDATGAVEKALDDDLNSSGAWLAIHEFIKEMNLFMENKEIDRKNAQEALAFMQKMDTIFRVFEYHKEEVPSNVKELVSKREEARKNKDWKTSDKLRDEIASQGWAVQDSPEGPKVAKKL